MNESKTQRDVHYPRYAETATGIAKDRPKLQSSSSSAEQFMQSSAPTFREKLISRRVIVKVSLFTRAFSGTITAADEVGFCLASDDMIAALREVTAGAMANMDAPSVYLPFSKLEWLVTSLPKAAAASA
jgi:hypothetical protein